MSGGQFDWGGRLLKGNGGAQRFAQNGWKSFVACKGISKLDCESYNSSRYESRTLVLLEAMLGYYPCLMDPQTRRAERSGGQCQVGSLTGAVAS